MIEDHRHRQCSSIFENNDEYSQPSTSTATGSSSSASITASTSTIQTSKQQDPFFLKRPPVNIHFSNITYTKHFWSYRKFKKETKHILHGVSGEFKSNELSVIMGPSGAGKSTLLNILAGFIVKGSGGSVTLNNEKRGRDWKSSEFRRLTSYIMQDDLLRPELTVIESMNFAAQMKLGPDFSTKFRASFVNEILEMLGLDRHLETKVKSLSGGQKRRLSIAHELLSNSPILFLDEPTTGLDSSSCAQCIMLLKRLAREGRTVICTIHQLSALLFDRCDSIFALQNGRCFYQGPVRSLLPHLADFGLVCPPFNNPADFIIEIATGVYGHHHVQKLSDFVDKQVSLTKDITATVIGVAATEKKAPLATIDELDQSIIYYEQKEFRKTSFFKQLYLHNCKNYVIIKRNYMPTLYRILANILIAIIFGYLYTDVGQNANTVLANYVYLYGTLLFTVYTSQMPVTLSFPLDIQILTREYFNRWYKLGPYFISMLMIEIPIQIFCTWSYVGISYFLTSQSMELQRAYLFFVYCTLAALAAQSFGYFIGATTSIKIAVFLSPIVAVLFSVFGFCLRYTDIPFYFRWVYHLSYFRAAFHSLLYTTYGLGKGLLNCPDHMDYCHFKEPKVFLREMDVTFVDLNTNAILIIAIGLLMYLLTFVTVWFKLNQR